MYALEDSKFFINISQGFVIMGYFCLVRCTQKLSLIKFRGIQCNCDRVILALIFLSEVIE